MEENENKATELVEFHFQKSNFFRVIKIHGAWGGISPRSEIQMNVFSERIPLPDSLSQEVSDAGLGKVVKHTGTTTGIVREVEAAITMTPDVARSLGQRLLTKVTEFEKLVQKQDVDSTIIERENDNDLDTN